MKTTILSVDKTVDNNEVYQQAVDILKNGGVVSFPTETVYGLGAIATNEQAVQEIFKAKGRPSDNPLIVHIGETQDVLKFASIVPPAAKKLMDAFWPGPITLILNKKPNVIAPSVTPGVETVGIRMPSHPVALQLLRKLGEPLAAPSANRSGKPSPTEAFHVFNDLEGRIPLIVDGGSTEVGIESTVIDMTVEPPIILRPGSITKEMIENVIGSVQLTSNESKSEAPRSPGMKYIHYAPNAPVLLIERDRNTIQKAVQSLQEKGEKVAVVGPDELHIQEADWYYNIGASYENMATHLYKVLREIDQSDATIILAVETDEVGIGTAYMNRLRKASDDKRYFSSTISENE